MAFSSPVTWGRISTARNASVRPVNSSVSIASRRMAGVTNTSGGLAATGPGVFRPHPARAATASSPTANTTGRAGGGLLMGRSESVGCAQGTPVSIPAAGRGAYTSEVRSQRTEVRLNCALTARCVLTSALRLLISGLRLVAVGRELAAEVVADRVEYPEDGPLGPAHRGGGLGGRGAPQ